ncbi:MAG: DUF721 domain-containing protein [Lentisphaerae bacterium]|nr:DUF721 domain-containing protein [Lentisphaerota bacterium]
MARSKQEAVGGGDDGSAAVEEDLEELSYEPPLKASSQLPVDVTARDLRRPREQAVAMAVERVLRRLGIEASPWLERLAVEWPTVAGAATAAKCRPGKFHNGILYVYVRNSVDLFNIRRNDLPALDRAVRAFAGDVPVRQVRLMIG